MCVKCDYVNCATSILLKQKNVKELKVAAIQMNIEKNIAALQTLTRKREIFVTYIYSAQVYQKSSLKML
jgi:hypothetical protein